MEQRLDRAGPPHAYTGVPLASGPHAEPVFHGSPPPDGSTPAPLPGEWGGAQCAAFLDALRRSGDDAADDLVRRLRAQGVPRDASRRYFAALAAHSGSLSDAVREVEGPDGLVEFARSALHVCELCDGVTLPRGIDRAKVVRGQIAFETRSLPCLLVLLCKSLPEGYAAPSMAQVLSLSGTLVDQPYHRLMGTLHLLVTVGSRGSFEGPFQRAVLAAFQIRLLHAGVRTVVAPAVPANTRPYWPGYDEYHRDGRVPVNFEDMLGTIIGFSLLVITGLERLGIPFDADDAEAYYYTWRTFAQLMGIHPPGRPNDASYLPPTLADAEAFYALYSQRNYVGPTTLDRGFDARAEAENPAGVALARSHVEMLTRLLPGGRRLPSLSVIPRFFVRQLCGDEATARVGVRPAPLHGLLEAILVRAPAWWVRRWGRMDRGIHAAITRWFLRGLVHHVYRGGVQYFVPYTTEDLLALVDEGQRGRGVTASAGRA